jgi:hypothetical protein
MLLRKATVTASLGEIERLESRELRLHPDTTKAEWVVE